MGPKLRGLILLPEFRLLGIVIHHEYDSHCQGGEITASSGGGAIGNVLWSSAIDAFVKTILILVMGNVALISESQI